MGKTTFSMQHLQIILSTVLVQRQFVAKISFLFLNVVQLKLIHIQYIIFILGVITFAICYIQLQVQNFSAHKTLCKQM